MKGTTTIELTDIYTGKTQTVKETNMVTNALSYIFNANIRGLLYSRTRLDATDSPYWMLPLYKNLCGGILLYCDELEEDPENIYAPLTNTLVGFASDDVNGTENTMRGSRNLTESTEIENGYKFVWDFATSQANGTISSLALTNKYAGKGADNIAMNIASSYTDMSGKSETAANILQCFKGGNNYQDNQFIDFEGGYRHEMITRNNSTQAIYRKIPCDYTYANLMQPEIKTIITDACEETTIELDHYPANWTSYTGGEKDGQTQHSTSSSVHTYLFRDNEGSYHGIATGKHYRSSPYNSDSLEYVWYLDTVKNGACTHQTMNALGNDSVTSLGMSGKWYVFAYEDAVYKVDTENAANVEIIEGLEYSSQSNYTNGNNFCLGTELVVDGWLLHDGKPTLHIGGLTSLPSYSRRGQGSGAYHVDRYKTYLFHEYFTYSTSSSSGGCWSFRYGLYLMTNYLATINNLDTPVIKTADKTMKITYTLTES